MKIKLKKRLWNKEKGEVIEVDEMKYEFALRKGYAEKVDPEQDKKNKVEPVLKTRKKK
jgi:hypothetical protein